MKRWMIVLMVMLLLLGGCSSDEATTEPVVGTSGDAKPYYPEEPIPVVIPLVEETDAGYVVTIHKGLLENDSTELNDSQIADGFLSAVRNEDDSITYTIAKEGYAAFVEDRRQHAYTSIINAVNAPDLTSLTSITCSDDLSVVNIYVIKDQYMYTTDGEVVFGVGLTSVMGQMYNIDAPGKCVITVYDENGNVIDGKTYPDEMVL